jgi:tripartite-type tricarboxylate transporter receptor subunit TctC
MAFINGATARLGLAACLIGSILTSLPARAADYPERPIRMVVPFAAGGTSDVLARLIGQKLGVALGQQLIIDNRPGANGNIGTDAVAKAPPDGYTIGLVADGTVAINPGLYPQLSFSPEKDLAPISRVALVPLIIVAHPSLKADTLPALIALGKDPSSDLNFSSAGLGSTGHLAGELIKSHTGMRMTHVVYRGGGQAVNDAVGGQVPLLVTALATAGPFIQAGQLKPIAVTSAKRVAGAPNVPTVAEGGIKDFDVSSWYAVMAPAGTPAPIINKLHAEIVKALQQPDLRAKMQTLGADPIGDTPAEFAAVLHNDLARWKRVVQDAKLTIQ